VAENSYLPHDEAFLLGYHPPYRWQELLGFLRMRAIPGVEVASEHEYFRTVRHEHLEARELRGWIKLAHSPEHNALALTVSESLLPVLPHIIARIRQQFDLGCEPHEVFETLASMNKIRPGLFSLGTRLPGSYDAFEMATRAVLGQQITVKAASTLAGRVASTLGTPLETGISGLTHLFPTPKEILSLEKPLEDRLGPLGIIAARTRTIEALAQALEADEITLAPDADPEEEVKRLVEIRGIGPWTAHYLAMRAMGWTDAFLETDLGIKKALAPLTAKEMLALAQTWQPWRSYATISLWNSLA